MYYYLNDPLHIRFVLLMELAFCIYSSIGTMLSTALLLCDIVCNSKLLTAKQKKAQEDQPVGN